MSGDVQPRKRKDKKKKKEEPVEEIPVQQQTASAQPAPNDDDVNIHVHKERTTGGEFCAKFIFFIVMAGIAVIIGLTITEYRGQTDLDTVNTESRFAPLFEGWVDKSQDNHDHEDDVDLVEHSEETNDELVDHDETPEEQEDTIASEEEEDDTTTQPDDVDDTEYYEKLKDVEEESAENQNEDNSQELDEIENQSEEIVDTISDENVDDEEYETEKDENDVDEDDDDQGSLTQTEVAGGIGVALLVVVGTLLLRKWKTDKLNAEYLNREALRDLYRRNTLISPPTIEVTEPDIGEQESDESEEEIETSTVKKEHTGIVRAQTPANLSARNYEEGDDGDDEEVDSNEDREGNSDEEVDDVDEELMKKLEAKYGKIPSRVANDSDEGEEEQVEEDDDDEEEEKQDDELKSWKQVKVLPDNEVESDESEEDERPPQKRSGAQSLYDFANITNVDDYIIRDDLDNAQVHLENNIPLALSLYTKILEKHPNSPRALYGKAQALDRWADKKRSNELLQDSVKFYVQVLKEKNVPDALYVAAAERCINRMRFVGHHGRAISIQKMLIDRFPEDLNVRNQLAVTYLTINRISEARDLLLHTLEKWPHDGFALVHYGFILKTVDNNLGKAVEYLRNGLDTGDDGVVDGRFYFHLGDAFARLGLTDEAKKVYEEGVDNNVFLSKYQRSLYNVDRLTGRPWWNKFQTPYTQFCNALEQNWREIRDEGLAILSDKGLFKDESENLRDVGDWKQFELYARGIRHVANCKKCPVTCKIIDSLSEAKSCKRGQVKFSVMHPGTHVWPHCGPTNCRLRIHLGLKVPSNTYIRVADETRSWEEGKILIFDDSFEHEVWHNGTEFRLVLIVDVWHPELTQKEKQTLSAI